MKIEYASNPGAQCLSSLQGTRYFKVATRKLLNGYSSTKPWCYGRLYTFHCMLALIACLVRALTVPRHRSLPYLQRAEVHVALTLHITAESGYIILRHSHMVETSEFR